MERENGFHAADVYTVCCCCAVTTIVDQWVLVLCLTRSPELKTSESESCVPVSSHSYTIDISTKYDPLHWCRDAVTSGPLDADRRTGVATRRSFRWRFWSIVVFWPGTNKDYNSITDRIGPWSHIQVVLSFISCHCFVLDISRNCQFCFYFLFLLLW